MADDKPPPLPPIKYGHLKYEVGTTLQRRLRDGSGQAIPTTTTIGKDTQTDQEIIIDDVSRFSGCYVIGTQGVGKSSLLEKMIYQDIDKNQAVIVLDPHGQLIENIVARMGQKHLARTYLLDITDETYPFGFNIFACRDIKVSRERNITRNRVANIFDKIWPSENRGLLLPMLLQNVTETIIEHAATMTMADIPALLLDEAFRAEKVRKLNNKRLKEYWQLEYGTNSLSTQRRETAPLRTRLNSWLSDPVITNIICQKEATIDFRAAIENREILLIKLPVEQPGYEHAAPIIGTMILSQIYTATFSFQDIPEEKRPGFSLYIDEFQYFATRDTARLFTGARKYKVRQTLAHQTRVQLKLPEVEEATLSANTIIAFKVVLRDSASLAPLFSDIDLYPGVQHIYADVFPHLKHHKNHVVSDFWSRYVRRWQDADEKSVRQKTEKDRWGDAYTVDVLPQRDLGHGIVSYRPEWVRSALNALERLLVDAQRKQKVNQAYRHALLYEVSLFLKFVDYYDLIQLENEEPENIGSPRMESQANWYHIFTDALDAAIAGVIKEPIGEYKQTGITDIADRLTHLPKRQALIRIGTTTNQLETLSLPSTVSSSERNKRLERIQKQTREKYCRPREEVEAELGIIDSFDEEGQRITLSDNETLQELAVRHPSLVLPKIRIDIEQRVRTLYTTSISQNAPVSNRIGLSGMIQGLRKQNIIDQSLFTTLQDIISIANAAIHGEMIESEKALQMISPAKSAIEELNRLLNNPQDNSTRDRFEDINVDES